MPHVPHDIYFVAAGPSQYTDHIGILDKTPYGQHPPLGDTGICSKLYVPTFKSRRDSNILVSLRNLGHDAINPDDLPVATEIIKSFRYQ